MGFLPDSVLTGQPKVISTVLNYYKYSNGHVIPAKAGIQFIFNKIHNVDAGSSPA